MGTPLLRRETRGVVSIIRSLRAAAREGLNAAFRQAPELASDRLRGPQHVATEARSR